MPKIDILNQLGEKVEVLELSDHVYGIVPHQQALFDVITAQKAALRQGTSAVKNRSQVSGGGKKPWRQKGTGRARQGSIRAPHWRGGGVVFGPTQRSYSVKLNKKVRNLAFRSALSALVLENKLTLLNEFNVDSGKTKDFNNVLKTLELNGKTLVITKGLNETLERAGKNIPTVYFQTAEHLSVLDLSLVKNVVITKDAALALQEALGNE